MNPYEAPNLDEKSAKLEQRFATLLLEIRKKGYSFLLYFRWQLKSYLLLLIFFVPGILFWISLNFPQGANLLFGILAGVFMKDLGLAAQQTKTWPIQEKLIDWDKVERMAAGEPLS